VTPPSYWHGCNYPWSTDGNTVFYALDFGANVWGSHLGVSLRRAAVERDFADMASLGLTVVRWFLFGDGRSGIVYDDLGMPAGLDPHVFADLDAALETASGAGIRLVLVLLDHRWMFEGLADSIADPVTGALLQARLPSGRARVLSTVAGRQALMEAVIAPVVRRYSAGGARADLADCVLAYELMNEPDFVIEEWERDLSPRVSRPVRFEALAELVTRVSATVHTYSTALSTVSAARLHNLWAWDDDAFGVDVLQVHSYPDRGRPDLDEDVFGIPASSLGVKRPVILGEFPSNAPLQHPPGTSPPPTTLLDYLEFGLAGGYMGAWPWSFSGTDVYGPLPREPLLEFARRHTEIVNPRCNQRS
jgi:hypothetical protein